ncbi:MAG: helix-turn-helix transcriptional regulator [Candidatus Cohnella colombiensis]|uniref:Helix-turn-helix transcriptional regulator n=1 Tax=Candidatus Cohnella colombiensis TaxID=3121368 RepID=A0AA95JFU2_9BACL|nr:MAG: helix-turn-helix transcriptional regulator [Cohnella sp.]
MIQKMKFGQCLKELLLIRDWSAARLATALNIDASYVRRWIQGNRTPSLHSSYINDIAAVLCDGIDRDYKKATRSALHIFLDQTNTLWDEAATLQDKVQHVLHEAQVYTLTLDVTSRRNYKQADCQTIVSQFLANTHREQREIPQQQPTDLTSPYTPIPSVLANREMILKAAISLLKSALVQSSDNVGREIILTFHSEKDYFEGYPILHQEWQQTIIEALRSGWSVRHLCKLNKNVERSLRLVNQILEWTNYSGAYSLSYFNKYGIDDPAQEIIVCKGYGAIMSYATNLYKEVDAGIYLNEPEAVRVIERFAEQMFHHAEPLIHILNQNEYFELNPTKDRKFGSQLMCMHDLSYLTVPLEIMEKYIQLSIPDEAERQIHWRRIVDTVQSFYRDIPSFQTRHIYPMRAIEELVRTREYYMNPYFRPTLEDIRDHLNHLIELLQTYDRFEIALIDDHRYDLIHRAQFDIKGDHTIAMGVMPRAGTNSKVELIAITEGTIVTAFQQYFHDIWDRINPIYRDKESVISWLREKLAVL